MRWSTALVYAAAVAGVVALAVAPGVEEWARLTGGGAVLAIVVVAVFAA